MRIAALLIVLAVAACGGASGIEVQVSAYSKLPEAMGGRTFMMIPRQSQEMDARWHQYANMVARKMELRGLRRLQDVSSAELAVFVRFGDISETSTIVAPIFGQSSPASVTTTTGYVGRTPVYGSSYTPPTYGIAGYAPRTRTFTAYGVRIDIYDVQQTAKTQRDVSLYQGVAASGGYAGTSDDYMPFLLDALFADWPGMPNTPQRMTRMVPL